MQTALNFKSFYHNLKYPWGTQKYKIYELLKTCCSATNEDFVRLLCIYRYGGRIMEIRRDLAPYGWTIRTERIRGGLFEYHLERGDRK